MRTHPDDRNVHALTTTEIDKHIPYDNNESRCMGCPEYRVRVRAGCPLIPDMTVGPNDPGDPRWCGNGYHWFGHHIYVANKLEGNK